jgi:hypothetical protein
MLRSGRDKERRNDIDRFGATREVCRLVEGTGDPAGDRSEKCIRPVDAAPNHSAGESTVRKTLAAHLSHKQPHGLPGVRPSYSARMRTE